MQRLSQELPAGRPDRGLTTACSGEAVDAGGVAVQDLLQQVVVEAAESTGGVIAGALRRRAWTGVLAQAGFTQVTFCDYLPRSTAQCLAEYDYKFSAFYLRHRVRLDVLAAVIAPAGVLRKHWRRIFDALESHAMPGEGAGFLVSATRSAG